MWDRRHPHDLTPSHEELPLETELRRPGAPLHHLEVALDRVLADHGRGMTFLVGDGVVLHAHVVVGV